MTKRPAEQLVADFQKLVDSANETESVMNKPVVTAEVPMSLIQRWLKLAKSVDARMRLDGSKLNRRKSSSRVVRKSAKRKAKA